MHLTSSAFNDGDTLTQGGVTATIRRVVVETGTLVSGVNTGRLIITAPGGGNFAAGAATRLAVICFVVSRSTNSAVTTGITTSVPVTCGPACGRALSGRFCRRAPLPFAKTRRPPSRNAKYRDFASTAGGPTGGTLTEKHQSSRPSPAFNAQTYPSAVPK